MFNLGPSSDFISRMKNVKTVQNKQPQAIDNGMSNRGPMAPRMPRIMPSNQFGVATRNNRMQMPPQERFAMSAPTVGNYNSSPIGPSSELYAKLLGLKF